MYKTITTKCCFVKQLFIISLTLNFSANAGAVQLETEVQFNQIQQVNNDTIYNVVEKMPEFPGGEKALIGFLNQTTKYPDEAQKKNEQGKVIVQFVISKTGKVENVKVVKGVSSSLDEEAIRVISLLPDWIPGEFNGEKVAVYSTLPIKFQNIPPKENEWQTNEKTVVVIDSVIMPSNFNSGILNTDKIASVNVLKPFPKEEKSRLIDQYGKLAENGVILISTKKDEIEYALADSAIYQTKNDNSDCKDEALPPEFVGGKVKLMKYVADSLQYPFVAKQLKTQGKVYVGFLVDITGKVKDAKVIKSIDYYLDREALRIIKSLPDWTPGAKCEQKLNIFVTLPIIFKLDLPPAEKGWERNDKTIVLLDGERLPSSFDLAWLNYANLLSYKVLQPGTKEINKKLVKEYGKDAVNGVILIETKK